MSRTVARSYYKRFLALTEKWPINSELAPERDPAVLLRKRIREAFLDENSPPINIEKCELQYQALRDIVENRHKEDFKVNRYYGMLGLSLEEIEFTNTEKAREYMEERDELLERVKAKLGIAKKGSLPLPNLLLPEEQKKLEAEKAEILSKDSSNDQKAKEQLDQPVGKEEDRKQKS